MVEPVADFLLRPFWSTPKRPTQRVPSAQFSCFFFIFFKPYLLASDLMTKQRNIIQQAKPTRFLISVTVVGSTGPIRFLVNYEELVATVIHTALRSYAREGRLPDLGSDINNFLLYPANAGSDALSPLERIGSGGVRNFVLCKKQQPQTMMDGERSAKGSGGSWKAWLNKSLNFKISSH